MAISFEYDHPHYLARHSETSVVLGVAGGTRGWCIPAFAVDMSRVTMTLITGGTTGTGATVIPTIAGTAIGTWVGTGASGDQVTYTLAAPLAVAALGKTNYLAMSTDVTLAFAVTWEYRPSGTGSVTF